MTKTQPTSDQLPWHSRLAEAALITYFPYSITAIISGIILGILGLFAAPLYLSAGLTWWLMLIPEILLLSGLGGVALIPVSIGLDSYLSHEIHSGSDESSSDEYDDDFPWDDNSDNDDEQ